jgi:hypothetical protein
MPSPVKRQGPTARREKVVVAAAAPTKNYTAPLRTMEVDEGKRTVKGKETEPPPPTQQHNTAAKGTERPSPIILTAIVNLIKFQDDN